ncbi:MAG: hypothetical protein ACRC51_04185 [Cetobacterium sp.]
MITNISMSVEELAELSHSSWKLSNLYQRVSELAEKALKDEKYIFLLGEAMKEVKEINERFVDKKIQELQK